MLVLSRQLLAVVVLLLGTARPATGNDVKGTSDPITVDNVDRVGLLSETRQTAMYVTRGPRPTELLLYPDRGILVVDDTDFRVLREIDEELSHGYAFSRGGNRVSWLRGTTTLIRNEVTGEVLEIDSGERPGKAVFSPDEEIVAIPDMIITGSEGEGHSLLRIFNANSGELIRKLEISMEGYGALTPVFSPDGKILAVGNRNHQTKLFDTRTWNLLHTLPKRMTQEIAFSPDGKTLAAGYVDGNLGLWDVESGKALHLVESGCSEIHSLAWNAAGDVLATSGPAGGKHGPNGDWIRQPGKVQLWKTETFTVAKELMDVQWAGSIRFSADDSRLIGIVKKKNTLDDSPRLIVWSTSAPPPTDETVATEEVPTLSVEHALELPAVAAPTVAVSPDGATIVAPLSGVDRLALWNKATGKQEYSFKGQHDWQIWQVAFSPDGLAVATASLDKTAKLWDAKTGALLATLKGHTDRLNYMTYSRAGKYLLTSTSKQWPYSPAGNVSVRVWDAKTGAFVSEFTSHVDNIVSATFTADETRVLTCSDDHTARLWEVDTGKELFKFDLGSGIRTASFSPDGSKVLTSSSGGRSPYVGDRQGKPAPCIKVWDAATGMLLWNADQPQAVTASFNESGDQILTECRGLITCWETASGKQLKTLREPLIGTEVVFCPTGKFFVVQTPDKPLELWSISTMKQVARLEFGEPYLCFFSVDSRACYALSRAGTFRSWSLADFDR